MIEKVLNDIRDELKKLKIKENTEFFDIESVPDSISDNSFLIAPVPLNPGDLSGVNNRTGYKGRTINLSTPLKILYSRKNTAHNLFKVGVDSAEKVEAIIKSLLSIGVGGNEKDSISFVGSNPTVIGAVLVTEIDFNINYRITNIT